MFFFRNKHIMVDLGTGNNNKINWALDDKQEMIDLVEVKSKKKKKKLLHLQIINPIFQLQTVYRGARKGRGLVVSLKDYSTKYQY